MTDTYQLKSADIPMITQAVIEDLEQRYQESVTNSIYVFPRHKSKDDHTDISLDSMNGVALYNLNSQNPTISTVNEGTHTRPSSKASESEGVSSEPVKESKSAAQGNKKLEFVKAELESIEKKVVSLGQEELLVLYRKTMNAYRETVNEPPKTDTKAEVEALVQKSAEKKKYQRQESQPQGSKPLVVKIVKNRSPKEKELEGAYKSQGKMTDKKAVSVPKKEEKKISPQKKDMTKFSKEFVHFLKEKTTQIKENMKPVLTTETDDDKLDTVRQITELGPAQTEEKPLVTVPSSIEKKSEVGKPTPKKTVNLYVCYKSSSVSRSQGPKSKGDEKPSERLFKSTKTVQVARDGNTIKEIKEVKEDPKKTKQVVLKEKAFSKTINGFEKAKEAVKPAPNTDKKATGVSTQNTEESRNPSRMRGSVSYKKGTTMYSDLYKTQKSKQSTDKKERVREFVAKALDLAKTMPAMKAKEDEKLQKKEEREDEKMIKEFEEIIEERRINTQAEKSLAWSEILASPVIVERKREENSRPMSSKFNLKVVTHSVVTEYEARLRRRANDKRTRKYF